MAEVCGEVEDDLIDLNKAPVERKRKRVESVPNDGGNEGINGLPKAGKVLRSRTRAMSDGEKQDMKMEDKEKIEVSVLEGKDGCKSPVLNEKKIGKRRPGRPPKTEGKSEVSPLSGRKKGQRGRPPKSESLSDDSFSGKPKGRRGRPPKMEGKCDASTLSSRKKDGKAMGQKKVDGVSNGAKRRPGRPPRKMENQTVVHKTSGYDVLDKKLEVGDSNLGNGVAEHKKGKVERAQGNELGLREQKQLLRDQIVAMLMKAGWTVEYRQRQSKDYQDAVYVDRNGKTHWSVTLAYKKFKEKIDSGKAEAIDVTAFYVIPEETLSKLFRVTVIGRKAGQKRAGGNTIKRKTKNHVLKIKTFDGYIKSKQGKQRTLLARRRRDGPDIGWNETYEGSRSLLAWMIDLGIVSPGETVMYKRGKKKKALPEGRLLKEGIRCGCCNIMHSVMGFEIHAKSPPGKPYQNIYLNSGNSLSQCLLDSWKKHVETDKIEFVNVDLEGDDPNDDTCNVCGDGGDLICCDSCPSTFHHGCLHDKVPSGEWYCAYCSCKFCEMPCKSPSNDDDDDDGGGGGNDGDDDCNLFSESLTCRSCEEKFHVSCIKGTFVEGPVEENQSFCGKECLKIFEQLQDLLGVRRELEDGYFYTILQHRALGDASLKVDTTIVECNSKLAVAFSVMDECFEPIIDERSGANLIHNVIYSCGSNIRRLNFDGFCTIILEKGDELVAVATIRIHGSRVAEMPFIGTRFLYRRQGMCSRLLSAIETVLCSLGVEKLVIPAISELNETWTKVFGFVPVAESERLEMRHMSMIVFPGVAMLKKPLNKGQMEPAVTITDAKCAQVGAEHQNMQENPIESAEEVKSKSNGSVPETQDEEQSEDNAGMDVSKSDVSSQVIMVNGKDNGEDAATDSAID